MQVSDLKWKSWGNSTKQCFNLFCSTGLIDDLKTIKHYGNDIEMTIRVTVLCLGNKNAFRTSKHEVFVRAVFVFAGNHAFNSTLFPWQWWKRKNELPFDCEANTWEINCLTKTMVSSFVGTGPRMSYELFFYQWRKNVSLSNFGITLRPSTILCQYFWPRCQLNES